MFTLYESTATGHRAIETFPTFDEAVTGAHGLFKTVYYEEDADYPGCADFFAENGSIYCIEPARV